MRFLPALSRSPVLRAASVYGLSGAVFAVANLLLARALPIREYSVLALVVALTNVASPIAPAGVDGVVNRRRIDPGPHLLHRVLSTSAVVGGATVVVGAVLYGLDTLALLTLMGCVLAGGAVYTAAAHFQSTHRFPLSLAASQSENFVLAAAALATITLGVSHLWLPFAVLVGGRSLAAVSGWAKLFAEQPTNAPGGERLPWGEALSYAGVVGSLVLLLQLERLVIPIVLSLEELATFAVLAAIVISGFRMLQSGVALTLLPRLRAATTARQRRRLLTREGLTVLFVMAAACIVLWYATPTLVSWLLADKYTLSRQLVLAALVSGVVRVFSAFTNAAVVALGNTRQLALLNVLGWLALGVGIGGAVIGAHWGLVGVVYGSGLGWLSKAVGAAWLAAPHLRGPHEEASDPSV
jgi:O-antigen/teichoic acid export membrane protein